MEEGRGFPSQGCSLSSNFSTRNSTLRPNVGTILFSVDPGHLLISLVGHLFNQQTLAEYLPRPECKNSLQPSGETDMQMRTTHGEVLATVEDWGSGWEWGKEPSGQSALGTMNSCTGTGQPSGIFQNSWSWAESAHMFRVD